jgi:hypothetical protein
MYYKALNKISKIIFSKEEALLVPYIIIAIKWLLYYCYTIGYTEL